MNKNTSEIIVERILNDMNDRSGFDSFWDSIDEETREEIKQTWIEIIEEERKKEYLK